MSAKSSTEIDPIKNERTGNVREVGSQAIWSLSSCKPGMCVRLYLFIHLKIYLNLEDNERVVGTGME